jgi:hypothetical protein
MPVPAGNAYSASSGQMIYAGRSGGPAFGVVTVVSEDAGVPYTTPGQYLLVELHGSGGQPTGGRVYSAAVDGQMAYSGFDTFKFCTGRTSTANLFKVRPTDLYGYFYGSLRRESMWLGFKNAPDGVIRLMTQRRLQALMTWTNSNLNTS